MAPKSKCHTHTDQVLKHKFQELQNLCRHPPCSVLLKANLTAGVHNPWPAKGPKWEKQASDPRVTYRSWESVAPLKPGEIFSCGPALSPIPLQQGSEGPLICRGDSLTLTTRGSGWHVSSWSSKTCTGPPLTMLPPRKIWMGRCRAERRTVVGGEARADGGGCSPHTPCSSCRCLSF